MVGMVEGILAKNRRRLAVNPFFFLLAVQSPKPGEVGFLEALRSVCGHLGASALPSICSSLDEEKFRGSKGDFPVKAQEGGRKVHGDMKMYRFK